MEAVHTSETMVYFNETTPHYIQEYCYLETCMFLRTVKPTFNCIIVILNPTSHSQPAFLNDNILILYLHKGQVYILKEN
jgi:hypothetical protein